MSEIMIRETDINWLKIIEMAFKRKDWGETYTLYVCGDVSIICSMDIFDFSANKARFEIRCIYPEDEFFNSYYSYGLLDYYLDNFTIKEFKTIVLKKIKHLIEEIIVQRTLAKARVKFKDKQFSINDVNSILIEKYNLEEDLELIEKIEDDDIRYDCSERFNEKVLELVNEEYDNLVKGYCMSNEDIPENLKLLKDKIKDKLK